MRFERLQIPAFGPFTNLELEFPSLPNDLHVFYGNNEAGKSSLLRAIRDLLFGIHGRSSDNFLHEYGKLRIKGEICNRDGQRLIFQRRKGNDKTLLDANGLELPASALVPFLGSVDQTYFSSMFGLGSQELREGAQELLSGEGHIGTALFSASMGGTPVQKVVDALQQEADQLFKGRATANVSIRPAVNRYKELLKKSREAMVNPERWEKLENELAEAEGKKEHLDEVISKLERELQWLSRCEDALPTVALLSEKTQKLAEIPTLPELASDFTPRAQTARQAVIGSQGEVQRLGGHLDTLQIQQQECSTTPAVVAEADILDQMHQDFGVYRERKNSMVDLVVRLSALEPQIRAGMHNLELMGEFHALENYRVSIPMRLACEEAASTLKGALVEQAENVRKVEVLEAQITTRDAELQALQEIDLTGLREALTIATEYTEVARTFSTSEAEIQRLIRETADQHRLIAGAPEDLDATSLLAVPASTTIRSYREKLELIKQEINSQVDKVRDAKERVDDIQAELGRLQQQGELPSEETLRNARDLRDHGWSLVLADWKGDGAKEEFIANLPLEEAFPQAIANADGVADKLRLHAEAVAQAVEKRFQISEIEKQADRASQKVLELQIDLDQGLEAWQAEWIPCGITPRSPLEMEEWREQWSEFRRLLGRLRAAEETLEQKRDQIQRVKLRLGAVLGQSEENEYSLLFASASSRLQDGERAEGRRIEMVNQLDLLRDNLVEFTNCRVLLTRDVDDSTEKWRLQCMAVGLPDSTSPDAGLTLLQERKDLLIKFDEWQELSNKSQSIALEISNFEKAVNDKAIALSIIGDTTEAKESALWNALTQSRKAQDRHDQLGEQIEQVGNELAEAQVLATLSDLELKDLMHLAGLTLVTELEPLLAHLEQRDSIQVQIDSLRNTLSGLARGQSVDEFVSKARSEDSDTLAERKSIAASEKDLQETTLTAIREVLFRLRSERDILETAGDSAADYRQQAESCAAKLKQDSARFLRLRVATHLLENQIEEFRKRNQGPLLQKSGEVFSAITQGGFSGLGAEFNADDLPVLVGLRPDGAMTPMEGLSDGSRDQLYLALRLVALDRYLEEHEPMPIILDDLLMTFDDERAKAILPLLGTFAKRSQVFLFTHHEHLVELCRQTLGNDQFHLHSLGNAT